MADFSSVEKINASWKHLFGLLGTSNGSPGKNWYEEVLSVSHIVTPSDIWADAVPTAINKIQAIANCGTIIENRSDSIAVTLSTNGSNWNISSSFIPKVGYQITNVFPNPVYIKSITNIVDLGSGNYTITLNNNTGVSAGSAVLHRRIFLTMDASSNGLAWFGRLIYGNSFSNLITDLIQPQKFGNGYTVRVFQSNGTEILTTQGAWIFNWQKACLLFANGYTPSNLVYSQPIYIEGFRYIGALGFSTDSIIGELNDTLRYDGTSYVANSSLKADGTNVYIRNGLVVSGSTVLSSGVSPSGTSVSGMDGEFRWDNNFLYIRTALGWGRVDLRHF